MLRTPHAPCGCGWRRSARPPVRWTTAATMRMRGGDAPASTSTSVLALDVGTTALKACVVRADGVVLGKGARAGAAWAKRDEPVG